MFGMYVIGFSTIMILVTGVKSFLNNWDRAYLYCSLMFSMVLLECLTWHHQYQIPGSNLVVYGISVPAIWFNHLTPFFLILLYREFLQIKAGARILYDVINVGLIIILSEVFSLVISAFYADFNIVSQILYRIFLITLLIIFSILPFYTLKYWRHPYYVFPAISSWIIGLGFMNFFLVMMVPSFRDITFEILSTGRTLFVMVLIEGTLFLIALAVKDKIVYNERVQFEKEANRQKLRALQTQMNPHFIFNCLNSIKSLNIDGQIEKATRSLDQFGLLMRQVLEQSTKSKVRLQDEIDNLVRYLTLEQLRLNNKFDFEIQVGKDVDTELIEIPPLMIQPYVENAVWHGISDANVEHGLIQVQIDEMEDHIEIVIQDNGIGIGQSIANKKPSREHASLGAHISNERIKSITSLSEKISTVETIDLTSQNNGERGTRVIIQIPILI